MHPLLQGKDAFHRVPDSTRMFGTRWNASLPTLLARAIWLALPATRAVAKRKQQKKGK